MDNTEKLLRAFIKSQGYEIETIVDTAETPITKQMGFMNKANLAIDNQGEYKRGEDDCYYLKASLNVDYKVTNKQKDAFTMSELIAHSDAWGSICNYVMEHKDDIKSGINDFGDLKPVWDFFNRNCEPFETINHEFGESELQ